MGTVLNSQKKMFQILYGSTAAGLYDQAAKLNAQARTLYLQSLDTYYKANDAAAYDDWVRARAHWDYFYHRFLTRKKSKPSEGTWKARCGRRRWDRCSKKPRRIYPRPSAPCGTGITSATPIRIKRISRIVTVKTRNLSRP